MGTGDTFRVLVHYISYTFFLGELEACLEKPIPFYFPLLPLASQLELCGIFHDLLNRVFNIIPPSLGTIIYLTINVRYEKGIDALTGSRWSILLLVREMKGPTRVMLFCQVTELPISQPVDDN